MNHTMPYRNNTEITFFGFVWVLSSLCGLAAMLRSGQHITSRLVWMSLTNSGFFGLGIGLWLHNKLPPHELIAVSLFAGLGGMSVIEFFFQKVIARFK